MAVCKMEERDMEVRKIKRILQISRGEILRVIVVEGRWEEQDQFKK